MTGLGEFDRVMGGGLVKGCVALIGGDPGIGKSTLLLQVMARLVELGHSALYVSGEESPTQIALRAQRLQLEPRGLTLMSEIELEHIESVISSRKPEYVVIDSIQTIFSSLLDSAPGSVSQVRDYEPYFLLDGRLSWEKGVCRLYVDATNITDTRYCDLGGIRLPGAWVTGGVVLTIGR